MSGDPRARTVQHTRASLETASYDLFFVFFLRYNIVIVGDTCVYEVLLPLIMCDTVRPRRNSMV